MRAFLAVLLSASLLVSGCKHHGAAAGSSATTGSHPPIAGSAASVHADQAAAVQQQTALLDVQTTEMETDVPAAAQRAIPAFKDALVRLTDDVLAAQPATATSAEVQRALSAVLPQGKAPDDSKERAAAKAAGKDEFDTPEKGDYGGEVKASVSDLRPGVLLVDASFGIMCGEDNILLGYSNAGGHWQRVLRWQASPYDKVSDAFGDIFIPTLLSPERNGHAVLLVVHGTPWCTSTESGFATDTFEIDPATATDKPFWHGAHSYRRADEMFKLKSTGDGFEIRTSVDDRIGDAIARTGIVRYALVGNTMQRVLPIAMNSRESVSEWLDMPRDEARLFTDAPDGSETWKIWDTLTFSGKSTDDAMKIPMLSYGDVHACSDPKRFQVELKSEVYSADNKTHAPGASYYFQLQETGNGYRIQHASMQADAACNGRIVALKASGYGSGDADSQ